MLTLESKAGAKFIATVAQSNEGTAETYRQYIMSFDEYCVKQYGMSSDGVIKSLLSGKKLNVYDVLSGFMAYIKTSRNLSVNTVRFFVKTVRNYLEFNDVAINKIQFKLKVRLPRRLNKQKQAIDKEDIRKILNATTDIREKTYLMFLAATGARATEALSVRLQDINFNENKEEAESPESVKVRRLLPATVFFRAEFTKTKHDRTVYLTEELKTQLRTWLDYKYRDYRSCYYNPEGKSVSEHIKPIRRPTDLIFAVYHKDGHNPKLLYMYQDMRDAMQMALKNAGMLEYEDGGKRMKITLHSFRRFVKTTISDLGQQDYSEWYIGHASASTYYRQKEEDKIKIFRKIEGYLTFLDFASLEAKGADLRTEVDQNQETIKLLQQELASMRKDQAIILNAIRKNPRLGRLKPDAWDNVEIRTKEA